MAQMCVGGAQRLADALVAVGQEAGGKLQINNAPRRILVEGERVVGVETTDGEIFRARKLVASGLNPQQTFLELIDEAYLPSEWTERARASHQR